MPHYIPLNKHTHQHAGWRKPADLQFARPRAFVPILLEEMPHLLPTLPLALVAGVAQTPDTPRYELVALLSLQPGQNLYLTPDGRWLGGYVPADFRAYPFRLLSDQQGRLALCIDQDSGLLGASTEADTEAFFAQDGTLTHRMQRVLSFLQQCERSRLLTQQAVELLHQHSLIVPWKISRSGGGRADAVEGIFTVDESALRRLPGAALAELQAGNALALAYAQLLSQHRLSHFTKLYDLHNKLHEDKKPPNGQHPDLLWGKLDETLKFNF